MTQLRELNLSNNKYLKDYSLLKTMKCLKKLDVSYNVLEDDSFLAELKSLTHLKLYQTHFHDLALLKDLRALERCV